MSAPYKPPSPVPGAPPGPGPQPILPAVTERDIARAHFQNVKDAHRFADVYTPAEARLSRERVDAAKAYFKDHPYPVDL